MDAKYFINSNICFSKQHLCKQPWSEHIHREPLASTQSPSRSRASISCSPGSGGMLDQCPAVLLSHYPCSHVQTQDPLLYPCHPNVILLLHGQGNASIRENIHREVVLELSIPGILQDSSTPRLCIPVGIPVICQTRTSVLRETIGVTSPLSGPRQLEPGVNDLYFRKCFKILG